MNEMDEVSAYSNRTGTSYENWEALIEAEANGYVAIAVLTHAERSWPWVEGPFPTKREAENARGRLRRRFKREQDWRSDVTARFFVRPLWKS